MTDNEIIKALKELLKELKGKKQLIVPEQGVKNLCYGLQNFLDLITRLQEKNKKLQERNVILRGLVDTQKAENEDIKFLYENLKEEHLEIIKAIKHTKAEAYKEFAERLKEWFRKESEVYKLIDNLVKEMVGENNA